MACGNGVCESFDSSCINADHSVVVGDVVAAADVVAYLNVVVAVAVDSV